MNTLILRCAGSVGGRNRWQPSLFADGRSRVQKSESRALAATPAAAALGGNAYGMAFAGLWVFIGLVGAIDSYLTVKYRVVMPAVEENPVGRWLIELDDQDVSLFVGCKMAGTVLALGILAWIGLHCRRTFAAAIIGPVALGQLSLLVYLFS